MGKALVLVGLVLAAVGGLMLLGAPLGRLPGDVVFRRGNATFYFPIVTSLVLSVALTVILALLRR